MSENSSQHSITIDNQKRQPHGRCGRRELQREADPFKDVCRLPNDMRRGPGDSQVQHQNGTLVADGKVTEVKYSDGAGKVGSSKALQMIFSDKRPVGRASAGVFCGMVSGLYYELFLC